MNWETSDIVNDYETTGVFRIQGQLLRAAGDAASQVTVEWINKYHHTENCQLDLILTKLTLGDAFRYDLNW